MSYRGWWLQVEFAELSVVGDRDENQDRVAIARGASAALLVAVDGMGGHADGARAAAMAIDLVTAAFGRVPQPVFDPQGFLHLLLGRAHARLVQLGAELSLEARPRATCALCLVQDGRAYWAHVGDSRIYHLRQGQLLGRTRDHSHVEMLLQEGLITEHETIDHPMRNFVESCLGGSLVLPGMSVGSARLLLPGDVLLVCTDGFWSGLKEAEIAGLATSGEPLDGRLRGLVELAVRTNGPFSDNTSAAALRWAG